MTPEESRAFTKSLEEAALFLLKHAIYKKPADLARRFDLPVAVVRYWWRHSDQETDPIVQSMATAKEIKQIRKASQTLENWEKVKRYRPECGAKLVNGKRCKRSVAIRPPEGWDRGCLADRCRVHDGLARRVRRKKATDDDEE
jgi:hypothetical protein